MANQSNPSMAQENANIEQEILKHADLIKSSLLTTFSVDDDDQHNPANSGVPTYQKSEYSSPEQIHPYMKQNKDKFTLMSLNLNSLNIRKYAKYEYLLIICNLRT